LFADGDQFAQDPETGKVYFICDFCDQKFEDFHAMRVHRGLHLKNAHISDITGLPISSSSSDGSITGIK
jgi:hypothetical protein